MAMTEKSVVQAMPEVSKWEMDYVKGRLDRVERKVKILIAILTEKKMIGDAMVKAIEETEVQDDNGNSFKLDKKTLEWLMN
jgi:hypothetical protein